jgi:hypothetical protein
VGNVHEVAQSLNPAARIVYVDIDSVAVQHSQELLRDNPNALALQGDIRTPDALVQHPDVQRLLDFTRPIGLLLIAILPFVPDDAQAFAIVTTLRHALVEGSYIVITHGSKENVDPAVLQQIENLYTKTNAPARYRPQAIIERFFQGLDFIDPGLVPLPIWRPDSPDDLWVDQPQRAAVVGGIGQVR